MKSKDSLSQKAIRREIRSDIIPEIILFDSIDSTNAEAKRLASSGYRSPTLIIADSQSAGRGRMGREFFSPAGSGIYMSLLYKSAIPVCDAVTVTTAAAVAVALSLEEATGESACIKWVNDIYMNGGKVSGILAESVVSDGECHTVVGIGVNVTTEVFPEQIKSVAASVGKMKLSRSALAARIYDGLARYIFNNEPYIEQYRARFMLQGEEVLAIYKERTVCGRVLGVDEGGGLILLPNGEKEPVTIISGEVSIRVAKEYLGGGKVPPPFYNISRRHGETNQ